MADQVFVAREQELGQLWQFLDRALGGQGQVCFVTGEAGSGKTALVTEFARRAQDKHRDLVVVIGQCDAHIGIGDPYLPFREVLGLLTGDVEAKLARGVITKENASRLRKLVGVSSQILVEVAPDLVGLFVPGAGVVGELGKALAEQAGWMDRLDKLVRQPKPGRPDLDQSQVFEQYTNVLAALAEGQPLLVIVDDLHWADDGSTGLLFRLGRRIEGSRILLLGTYRPEEVALERAGERHPMQKVLAEFKRYFGEVGVDLDRAREAEGKRFVDAVLATEPNRLSEGFRQVLFQHTKGHPLFTIELLRAMQERGDLLQDETGCWVSGPALDWEALPARVEGVIEERINRLEEELRDILTVASVEGETFTAQVVARVQETGERRLLGRLSQQLERRHRLVQGQGELQVGQKQLSHYRFAHVLFQQHLYNGLSAGECRLLHGEIGAILEALYGEQTEAVAVQLARHYTAAGQAEKAVEYLLQAGDRARGLYASQEAINHYKQALDILKGAGDLDRAARTQMKLGLTHHTAFQFSQARQAYEEGFALWQRAAAAEPVVPPPPAPHALRLAQDEEPLTLDFTVDSTIGIRPVVDQLFSGLVELGLDLDVVPDIARRWEIRKAGRRYVFYLRDDARWSDGTPVTAQDFQHAWLRMLDPTTDPGVASLLYDVQGARAFHQGRAKDPVAVGVRAPDDRTLIVDLEGPTGYFLHLLAWMYPVPRHVVEAHGEAWAEPGNLVSNGPFRLEASRPGRLMSFTRNPAYHGRFKGNVERVDLQFADPADSRTDLAKYEADEVEVVPLRTSEISLVGHRHAGEYIAGPVLTTAFLWFDVSRPPFDDRRVRRAFVLAIDKQNMLDVTQGGHYPPATGGLVPPGMPGHSPGIGLPYDPGQARRLLAEAGYPGGRGFPAVEALTFRRGYMKTLAEYRQAQWRQELGVDVAWVAMDTAVLVDRLGKDRPHMSDSGWLADYPDPDNFLRVGVADVRHHTRWQHEEYDWLVEEARRAMDQGRRMELYRQADRILIEEAAIAPLFYGHRHLLVKPWVKRFPTSTMLPWLWKDIVIEPHP